MGEYHIDISDMSEEELYEYQKKQAFKAMKKEYPRTEEGTSNFAHSYLYLKHIDSYVYAMQKSINHLKPVPDQLYKPTDPDSLAVEDMISIFSTQVNRDALDIKTNSYHAKILKFDDAKKVFQLQKDVNLPDLPKTIIPYERARQTIIKNPESLCVINCPCRESRGPKGCTPRDVCIVIGEPWVSFVLTHSKSSKPRRITQEEALHIVERQHKMGNVHAIFYKASENERTYALCNCCPCCCTCMLAYKYAHSPVMASSGYKAKVDESKCVGCGICQKTCGFDGIIVKDGKAVVMMDQCKGCGACEGRCPKDAISFIADDPEVCQPLDLKVLAPDSF